MSKRWANFICAMAALVTMDIATRLLFVDVGAEFIELIIIAFVVIWLGEKE